MSYICRCKHGIYLDACRECYPLPKGNEMNEQTKQLAEQARLPACHASHPVALKRFEDLIRQDERKACAEHYLGIMRDAVEQAVEREREACAKLCEDTAAAIRARGNT